MTLSGSHQTKSDVTLKDQLNALLAIQREKGNIPEGVGGQLTSDPVAYFERKIGQMKQKLDQPASTKFKTGLTRIGTTDQWKLKIALYNKPYYPFGDTPVGGFYAGNKEWMTRLVDLFEALAKSGQLDDELKDHKEKYGTKPKAN